MDGFRIERLTLEHALTVVAEWAAIIGVLTYSYSRAGAGAVGATSFAILAPHVVGTPILASAMVRFRPLPLRRFALASQAVLYAVAALTVALDSPLVATVAAVAIAIGTTGVARPTAAVLLPWLARSTRDLVRGNLWGSYTESASAFVGPLLVAAVVGWVGVGGPFVVCSVATATALAISLSTSGSGPEAPAATGERGAMTSIVGRMRQRPWTAALVLTLAIRHFLMGAMDVLIVIMAFEAMQIGASGPGLLSAMMGFGAMVSIIAIRAITRIDRLSVGLLGALGIAGLACIALAATGSNAVTYAMLIVLGLAASLLNNGTRILLQRSVDPGALGAVFAGLGLAGGAGEIAGAVVATTVHSLAGLGPALVSVGVVLGLTLLITGRGTILADRRSDVPVVEMTLLRGLDVFAPLPPLALESIARSAQSQAVDAGTRLIVQGDSGDTFYVVIDGTFDVDIDGGHVRTIRRGGGFGEVALLAATARTATVSARTDALVLAIQRGPFLDAITGHQPALEAARLMVGANRYSGGEPPELLPGIGE